MVKMKDEENLWQSSQLVVNFNNFTSIPEIIGINFSTHKLVQQKLRKGKIGHISPFYFFLLFFSSLPKWILGKIKHIVLSSHTYIQEKATGQNTNHQNKHRFSHSFDKPRTFFVHSSSLFIRDIRITFITSQQN